MSDKEEGGYIQEAWGVFETLRDSLSPQSASDLMQSLASAEVGETVWMALIYTGRVIAYPLKAVSKTAESTLLKPPLH